MTLLNLKLKETLEGVSFEQVGGEASNSKVFSLVLLFRGIPLQVQEVGLEVLQSALTRELDDDDWEKETSKDKP